MSNVLKKNILISFFFLVAFMTLGQFFSTAYGLSSGCCGCHSKKISNGTDCAGSLGCGGTTNGCDPPPQPTSAPNNPPPQPTSAQVGGTPIIGQPPANITPEAGGPGFNNCADWWGDNGPCPSAFLPNDGSAMKYCQWKQIQSSCVGDSAHGCTSTNCGFCANKNNNHCVNDPEPCKWLGAGVTGSTPVCAEVSYSVPAATSVPTPTPDTGDIRGSVFNDTGKNATKNSKENYMGAVRINVLDSGGDQFEFDTSNSNTNHPNPNWRVDGVPNGSYSATIVVPSGYEVLPCANVITPNNPSVGRYFYCQKTDGSLQLKQWTSNGSTNKSKFSVAASITYVDFPLLAVNACSGTDTTPPTEPESDLFTCSYNSTVSGVNQYTVYYSWFDSSDVCSQMHAFPYWAQIWAGADWYFNTWLNVNNVTPVSLIPEGTTVSARVLARDELDNQSTWSSPTDTLLVNTANCGGVPTPTVTTALSPTPEQTPWTQLKNSSYQTPPGNTLSQSIPTDAQQFDADAVAPFSKFILGVAGTILGPINPTPPDSMYTQSYNSSLVLNSTNFIQYVKSRKSFTTITDLSTITDSGIYYYKGNNLQLTDLPSLPDGKTILLLVDGGNVSFGALTSFNHNSSTNLPKRSIAVVAQNITFPNTMTQADGIFIADSIDSSSTTNPPDNSPLKIYGNFVSAKQSINYRQRSAVSNKKPSIFIVNDIKAYLDLLPYLSISTYDWKQLQ